MGVFKDYGDADEVIGAAKEENESFGYCKICKGAWDLLFWYDGRWKRRNFGENWLSFLVKCNG